MVDDSKKQKRDMITDEPQTLKVLDVSKTELLREFKPILNGMKDKYLTAKEMHKLYFDPTTGKYERGLKTIYRYIEKLKQEGFIKEGGQRMTEGSRVVETLYCRTARIFFYEGPGVLEQWKSAESKQFLKKAQKLLEQYIGKSLDDDHFYKFAINYFEDQDRISSELIRIAQNNEEVLGMLKELSPEQISKLIFLVTNFAILKKS